jgi:hypothetical protein
MAPLGLEIAGVTWGRWFRETNIPGMLPGAAASVVWVGLGWTFEPASWLALGLVACCGWTVYLISMFLFALQPEDRSDFANIKDVLLGKLRNLIA